MAFQNGDVLTAAQLNALAASIPIIATGSVSQAALAGGTNAAVAVEFPAGLFDAPPDGLSLVASQSRWSLAISDLTKDGVNITVANWTSANSAGGTIIWTAIRRGS